MSTAAEQSGVLLQLAVEAILPAVPGCAEILLKKAGSDGEKPIQRFGRRIIERWEKWFRDQPNRRRLAALEEMAGFSADDVRQRVSVELEKLAPEAKPEDRAAAVDYLTIVPQYLDEVILPAEAPEGDCSLPETINLEHPNTLLPYMPAHMPPYSVPANLPGTPYRLERMVGSGGFGAVYLATDPNLQYLRFAIKFCLDSELIAALQLEQANLELLMKAGAERGAERIVRLYGYNLNHATPYLVYEFLPDGSLAQHVLARQQIGAIPTPNEVLHWIVQILEGLTFAHQRGLVHRDLKPANVLRDGDGLKLGDFGLGGKAAILNVLPADGDASTGTFQSLRSQSCRFRGAGTPLYMSPEQRRGDAPDPRHDMYSLGVLWYQFLTGDVTREMHPGWAKELTVHFTVPRRQVEWIERCVSRLDQRPNNAGELLAVIRAEAPQAAVPVPAGAQPLRCPACGRRALPRQKTCHYCYTPMIRGKTVPVGNEVSCPSCKAAMKSGSVVCIECGYNTRTGQKVATNTGKKRQSAAPTQFSVPTLIKVYGYLFMMLFGGTALITLVGMCLIFFVKISDLPQEVKGFRRVAACSGTLQFLLCCMLFTLGDALRKGRRAAVLGLGILFVLTLAGGVLLILPAYFGNDTGPGLLAGIYVLSIGTALFVPPLVVGISRWQQLE
jgi:serine/threonine protein kinase